MIYDNEEVKTCFPVDKVTAMDCGNLRRRIRELPLPTYKGDIAEWRAFLRRFNEIIETAIAKASTGHAVRTARLLFDSGANISLIISFGYHFKGKEDSVLQ